MQSGDKNHIKESSSERTSLLSLAAGDKHEMRTFKPEVLEVYDK
jgi:hypothetical protein